MRTSLWISAALLVAVILAGSLSATAMRGLSQQYVEAAQELRVLTAQEDWAAAQQVTAAWRADWQKRLPALQTLINHDDTDDVTLSLATLEAAIAAQDRSACLAACAALREHAMHLFHRDAFTLANVL